MLDLIISGGTVVTPHTTAELDVGIAGEHIVAVGQPGTLSASAGRVIDATGKIVLPGGIEPHAHIGIPVPPDWTGQPDVMTQPPEAASRAAAFGGVTTIIDFAGDLSRKALRGERRRPLLEVLERRRTVFRDHCYTDFAFHCLLAVECGHQAAGDCPREPAQVGAVVIFEGHLAGDGHGRVQFAQGGQQFGIGPAGESLALDGHRYNLRRGKGGTASRLMMAKWRNCRLPRASATMPAE